MLRGPSRDQRCRAGKSGSRPEKKKILEMRSEICVAASKIFELDAGRVRLILGEWHKELFEEKLPAAPGGGEKHQPGRRQLKERNSSCVLI